MTERSNIHVVDGACVLFLIVALIGPTALIPGALAILFVVLTEARHVLNVTLTVLQAHLARQQQRSKTAKARRARQRRLVHIKNTALLRASRKSECKAASLAKQVQELEVVGEHAVQALGEARNELESKSSRISQLERINEHFSATNADLMVRNEHLSKKLDDLVTQIKGFEVASSRVSSNSQVTQPSSKEPQSKQYKRLSGRFDEPKQAVNVPMVHVPIVPAIIPSHALPDNIANVDPRCLDPSIAGFTCIGITQKGKRCGQSMISAAEKSDAARMILSMRLTNSGPLFDNDSLCRLANALLCPRWHKHGNHDNTNRIAGSWHRLLKEAGVGRSVFDSARPVTPQRSRASGMMMHSPSSSVSLSPSSTISSYLGSPSTAATTPEREVDRTYQFSGLEKPVPFGFLLSKAGKDALDNAPSPLAR